MCWCRYWSLSHWVNYILHGFVCFLTDTTVKLPWHLCAYDACMLSRRPARLLYVNIHMNCQNILMKIPCTLFINDVDKKQLGKWQLNVSTPLEIGLISFLNASFLLTNANLTNIPNKSKLNTSIHDRSNRQLVKQK